MATYLGGFIDRAALTASNLSSKVGYFADGYGDMEKVEECRRFVAQGTKSIPPIEELVEDEEWAANFDGSSDSIHKRYHFKSPIIEFVGEEEQCKTGWVEIVSPKTGNEKGVVVLTAMTGDAGFSYRRDKLAIPLAKAGYVSLLPISPFMGKRKPENQFKTRCATVSDYVLHSFGSTFEGTKLVEWARKTYPGKPIGVSGVSVGGTFSIMSGMFDIGDLAIIAYIPGNSASAILNFPFDATKIGSKKKLRETLAQNTLNIFAETVDEVTKNNERRVVAKVINARQDVICPLRDVPSIKEAIENINGNVSVELKTIPGGHIQSIGKAEKLLVPEIIEALEMLGTEM
mmetsp:Transcript_63/g.47  ORF Transcript_63/g.47 Transcript_63/m.47 type:complete len:345 (+) Transcript_63:280-1314(+)|eukprot:CAMPEP_0184037652 /NCGR_PEP_ID=MMETSP0955-20130417/41227_1 /TAXON_ID=627963 /ORGANISM="Aplanochytrium sp, Strain PBS07" /LENGTH=344 /DNA_ID=CAMNT_0026325869 /DNA_START=261 /DNA_END=1292 /DNA_ORIENTATION=-